VRALTEWLSDAETVKDIERHPSVSPLAKSISTSEHPDRRRRLKDGDFWEMIREENKTGKRGAPRKPSRFLRFIDRHDPDRRSKVPDIAVAGYLQMLPTNIRNYAGTHSNELEKHFAGWCRELAEAMEAGDAARAAECGYRALLELESLYDSYLLPYAEMTRTKIKKQRASARNQDPKRGIDAEDEDWMNRHKVPKRSPSSSRR
jgi:hypothetical protein